MSTSRTSYAPTIGIVELRCPSCGVKVEAIHSHGTPVVLVGYSRSCCRSIVGGFIQALSTLPRMHGLPTKSTPNNPGGRGATAGGTE